MTRPRGRHLQRFDHAILDGVEVGIITTDLDGVITFANRSAIQLLHSTPQIVGAPVRKVLQLPDDPPALLGGEPRRLLDYPMALPDGTELDLQLSVTRDDVESEDRVGFFFIFRNVREEKLREEAQRRLERLAAMGTMVAGFAHEVRNPIAAMRSITEELEEDLRDRGIAMPHVGLLLGMIERIERLVRTSLQFGRPAAPKRSRRRPWEIVATALAELKLSLRDRADGVTLEVESDLPDVHVDFRQLAQVLVILLHNAIDAAGATRVVLRACRSAVASADSSRRPSVPPSSPTVRFEVTDTGPGIAPEIMNRIFDPFFTTKSTGTGLGLSIAQRIVTENEARLEVTSAPGGPTSFAIVVQSNS